MNFPIPPGLTELMQEFTLVVLKERPTDLVDFAADYFIKLRDSKKEYGAPANASTKPRGVKFVAADAAANNSDSDSSGEEPGK